MDRKEFWRLIEDSRAKSGGKCEAQARALECSLALLPPAEIIAFDGVFWELRHETYRWDLWGAAYLINGGWSDDGFEYFRCWLIGQGERIYIGALQNPDSLADVVTGADDEEAECEALLYAADHAYKALTGEYPTLSPPEGWRARSDPVGDRWEDEAEIDVRLPRLAALFPA